MISLSDCKFYRYWICDPNNTCNNLLIVGMSYRNGLKVEVQRTENVNHEEIIQATYNVLREQDFPGFLFELTEYSKMG